MSSGNINGTIDILRSRQSTILSAHRHGCGHDVFAPHSCGEFSVKPETNRKFI